MRRLRSLLGSQALVLAAALALRLAFLAHYVQRFRPGALGVLPFLFEPGNVARALALGHGFASPLYVPSGPTAWLAPVYPLLLAAGFRLFGLYSVGAFLAAALFNIACSAAVCPVLVALGRRLGGVALGATAAWLWALFPNAILLPVESLWPACLAALLAAVALLWALGLDRAQATALGRWVFFGLLWAAILMTTPALVSLLPCLLVWIVLRRRRTGRPWRGGLALALGILIAGCLPWTLRNARRLDALITLRSDLGLALWMGNNPQATIWPNGALHPINNAAERAAFLSLGEPAYMRAKREAALTYIAAHPRRVLRLAGGRFVALWAGGARDPWRALLVRDWRFRGVLLFNLLLAAGSLAGLVLLARRRAAVFWPLAAYPVVFPAAYYFTAALPRYLLPIQPVAALLTALALAALARALGRPMMKADGPRGFPAARGG